VLLLDVDGLVEAVELVEAVVSVFEVGLVEADAWSEVF
jgi:hypothetical protein